MEYINSNKLIQSVSGEHAWFGSNYNMNIYRGCNHGCIYCDSRSSCYQIHEFDKVKAKKDAPLKIEKELSTKRKKGVISLGGMNDPYNPFEKEIEYTRQALISINKHSFGAFVITKSNLVTRDIDIFKEIKTHSVCNVAITITTSDDRLQSRIERNVTSTSDRFKAIKELRDNDIFAGILMMPILPFINDTKENIRGIVEQAKAANANYIYPSFGVTLRDNQREHFFGKIGEKLTKQYMNEYEEKYMCVSPKAKELKIYFTQLCEDNGILYKMKDIIRESTHSISNKQLKLEF